MVKVLHILDHSLPLHSGYSFRSQSILVSQRKRGLTPVAITSPKHEESWKRDRVRYERIVGIPYYRTGTVSRSKLPVVTELRLMVLLRERLRQVVLFEKPNILHAHSPILNVFPALYVGRELGVPVVYEIRAFWEDAAVDHGTYNAYSMRYRAVRQLETRACRQSNQVAVLCEGLKLDVIKRGIPENKITMVPNGVNLDDFIPCRPDSEYRETWGLDGKRVIGFIGSFYRYEGLDLLVEGFAQIVSRYPNAVLLLIGGGETEKNLKRQIEKLGLDNRVLMPGRISHERVPGCYALMDVLVYPRYSMRLTDLVTPLKPLEAMAMGKAVVASDVGGHRELVRDGETGLLFKAGDVYALRDTLRLALDDVSLRKRLEDQGRAFVCKARTWDNTVLAYQDIYRKALCGRG
jgi:PEP-CTERM/exosortase A-associated glycosyltransferase